MKKHRQNPVARAVSLLLTFAMLTALLLPAGAVGTEEAAAPATPTDSSFVPAAFETAESLYELFDGYGSEDEPFEVNSVEQLVFLQKLANGQANEDLAMEWGEESGGYGYCFLLTADLDLSSYGSWTPIGDSAEHYFGASFDGGHHTISGLNVSVSAETGNAYAGLFGNARGAEFSNLTVKGSVSAAASADGAAAYAGGVVGYAYVTKLTGCAADVLTVTATVSGSTDFANTTTVAGTGTSTPSEEPEAPDNRLTVAYAGGVAGYDEGAADFSVALAGCSVSAAVTVKAISTGTGTNCGAVAGGVIGMANGVDLTGCSSAANVSFQTDKNSTATASYVPREFYYITSAGGVVGALLGAVEDSMTNWRSSQSTLGNVYTFGHTYTLLRPAAATNCTSTATVSAALAKTDKTTVLYYPAVGGVVGATSYANVTDTTSAAQVSGGLCMGGVAGLVSASTVSGCTTLADAGVSAGEAGGAYVGGVIGVGYRQTSYPIGAYDNVTVTGCVNNAPVSGAYYTGGIVGYGTAGNDISDCTNNGAVTATGTYTGGVTGYAVGTLLNCTNTGAVTATSTYTGGICGYGNHPDSNTMIAAITNCTNSGPVTGSGYVGGIGNYAGILTGNTNTGPVTGVASGAALYVGGILGSCAKATVNACVNEGTVQAISGETDATAVAVGGLAGFANLGTTNVWQIYNSVNKGNVTSGLAGTSMGGLVGIAGASGRLFNSYSLGAVSGSADYAGGVAGRQTASAAVINCYSAGAVSSDAEGGLVGGVVGGADASTGAANVTNNYYQADACAQAVGQEVSIGAAGSFDRATLALTAADGETTLLADDLTGALDRWVKMTSDTISLRWELPESETYPTFTAETVSPADVPGVYTFTADGGETTAESFTGAYGSTLSIQVSGYLSAEETTDEETGETTVTYTGVNGTMSYQWYESETGYPELDGTMMEGQTGAVLTVDTTQPGIHYYYVVGTNTTVFENAASSQSQVITVTVDRDPDDSTYYAGDVAEFSGSGTVDDPYIIDSPAKLAYLAQQVNGGTGYEGAYFQQTADLDLNNQPWTPIGTLSESSTSLSTTGSPFRGVYDGGGYKIINLKLAGTPDPAYNSATSVFVLGLFGKTSGATIKNLTLESGAVQYAPGEFSGSSSVQKYVALGALVGSATNTVIENCRNTGVTIPMDLTLNQAYVNIYLGGLVGYASGSVTTMKDCSNSVDLQVNPSTELGGTSNSVWRCVGGLLGYNESGGAYTGCTNSGAIYGQRAGGIVGYTSGSVTGCANSGAITGYSAGGITGDSAKYSSYVPSITDCTNSGAITALFVGKTFDYADRAGGIVGCLGGTALNCVNTGAVTGYVAGGIAGALNNNAVIANSYNTGAVVGAGEKRVSSWDSAAGGIAGANVASGKFAVYNCYSTGEVTNQLQSSSTTGNTGVIAGYLYGTNTSALTIQDCYYTEGELASCGGIYKLLSTLPIVNVLSVGVIGQDGQITAAEGTTLDFIGAFSGAEGMIGLLNCWAAGNLAAYPAVSGWKAGTETNAPAVLTGEMPPAAADFTVTVAADDEDGAVDYGAAVTLTAAMDYGENEGERGTVTWQWYRSATNTNDPALATAIDGETGTTYTFRATEPGYWYYFAVATNAGAYSKVTNRSEALKLTVGKDEGDVKWYGVTANAYAGGDGTAENPYQIATPEQLAYMAQQVNGGTADAGAFFKLTEDLDLNSCKWTSIGDSASCFSGTFDGDGHTVSGLYSTTYGLFGYVSGAVIRNLTVSGKVAGSSYAALLVSNAKGDLTLENCVVSGTVSGGGYLAGLVGYTTSALTLTNCGNEANITSTSYRVGGLVGYVKTTSPVTITNCYNTGAVETTSTSTSTSYGVGGLIGYLYAPASVTNCYNIGNVSHNVNLRTGGLVGYLYAAGYETAFTNCYNAGTITVGSACTYYGALVGLTEASSYVTITNCHYLSSACATENTGAGIACTEAELTALASKLNGQDGTQWKDGTAQVTFAGEHFTATVDGTSVTSVTLAGYPALAWEESPTRAYGDVAFAVQADSGYELISVAVDGETLTPVDGVYTVTVTGNTEITVAVQAITVDDSSRIERIISSVAAGTQDRDAENSTYDETLDFNVDGKNNLLDILDILYRQETEETEELENSGSDDVQTENSGGEEAPSNEPVENE